ncbi:hypothetical protein F0562_026756 [Nyssa sinensis]|uniref:Chromo domain-containing protein n=1 Tax=Nyssa sinensis TaxID=561372 RepID=A0A5J5BBM4_9ASTE|nr:hypothetical protein F0562_026756 [Nyssa sinensis]
MAEGHNTRYSHLAESLASVRETQEIQHQNQETLQQAVEGLTAQLQLVVANVETLVRNQGKQKEDAPYGLTSHMGNPLFEEHGSIQTRAIHLDFPKFDGEEPNGWIYRANHFFTYHQTNPHHRVLLASFHMEETLTRVRQTTTVEAYKTQFEVLSNQLKGLAEPYKLSCFLSGLREDIRFMVCMLNPSNLTMAFGMAKMQEENVTAFKAGTRMGSTPTRPLSNPPTLDTKALVPVQRLSPLQMTERRARGLCYNCDEKWGPGHKCKSARLFILECADSEEEEPATHSTPTTFRSSRLSFRWRGVYGYPPPPLLAHSLGTTAVQSVEDTLKSQDQILRLSRGNLHVAQERMKRFADLKRTEWNFDIGDWVYLRLQPYKQHSVVQRKNLKLSPRFYGPYQIVERIGHVAYRLDLPSTSLLHPVFHVSCLKRKLGAWNVLVTTIPPVVVGGGPQAEPEEILQQCLRKKKGRAVSELLVKWKGLGFKEASWVDFQKLQQDFPDLEGKVF